MLHILFATGKVLTKWLYAIAVLGVQQQLHTILPIAMPILFQQAAPGNIQVQF